MSVTTDLVSDQRVDKVCNTLFDMGFEVLLVGRQYKTSPQLEKRKYETFRLRLLFKKGKLFYAEINIRLFFFLLFHRMDILHVNDLDTLLPNVLIGKLKNKPIVYDSHEYFTEVPELTSRPKIQRIWEKIEQFAFPKVNHAFTVCEPIAQHYRQAYQKDVKVLRNIPLQRDYCRNKTKVELGLPEDKAILLLQGTGINVHRGAEELVEAMTMIDNALLLIIGNGEVFDILKQMSVNQATTDKIRFIDRLPFDELYNYTVWADIGFSLTKAICMNYRYALPNKLFDFIRARVPIIASPDNETARLIQYYNVGIILQEVTPKCIADAVNALLADKTLLEHLKHNTIHASQELSWENESVVLKETYQQYL